MMRLNKLARITLLSAASLMGTVVLPSIASADGGRFHDAHSDNRSNSRGDSRDRDDHRHDDRRRDHDDHDEHSKTDFRIDINFGGPRYEPVYEERTTRVWVEPTYRTVCDRVWIAPVYRTECDRVWEPDRWGYRDVVHRDRHGHRVIHKERVLIERGHWRNIERQVLVCEGYWKTVERQELVCAGHWEYRTERAQVGTAPVYSNPVIDLFASLTR